MYYQQPVYQPPPQYGGCQKILFYLLSFFIPIVGIILGIVYMSKPDPESKSLGRTCLILAIVAIVLGCCIGTGFGVLPLFLEGMEGY